jgi:hypothetical protein
MPHSALKCALRSATGLKRPRGLWHSADNLSAEPLGLRPSAGKFYHRVGILQFIEEWWLAFCGMLESRMPQVLNARMVCGIPRTIWARSLANDWIPVPAILHRQVFCLLSHKFLTRDSTGARYIRVGLFRPKLYTNGLSWHTISWY